MRYHTHNFLIKKEKLKLLQECLRELFESSTEAIDKRAKVVAIHHLNDECVFGALYASIQMKPNFSGKIDNSDITGFDFMNYCEDQHDVLFAAIAPAIEPGGWIQIEYEYGNIRRYSFDGERCINEPAALVVPSDTRYVVISRVLNEHGIFPTNGEVKVYGSYEDEANAKRCFDAAVAVTRRDVPIRIPSYDVLYIESEGYWKAYAPCPGYQSITIWIQKTNGLVPGIPAGE